MEGLLGLERAYFRLAILEKAWPIYITKHWNQSAAAYGPNAG
jgi:hypothetical protein